jgi:gentisate 1,2-dioxygenase
MTRFVDLVPDPAPESPPQDAQAARWQPVVIPGARIEAEAARLAAGPAPRDGRRETRIVHPDACARGLGLAPGIEVRLCVLRPGERSAPFRHNAAEVSFCIAGRDRVHVGGRVLECSRYDVWNQPSWTSAVHENPGDELQVRLVYSNAALLRLLEVYLVDPDPPQPDAPGATADAQRDEPSSAPTSGAFPMGEGGAWLMPYERLIDPPRVASPVLHWPWREVKERLDKLAALGARYRGRRLYLLYNPLTGRTNGTTPAFFATMTVRPPGIVDRPHRHVSAAINYYFSGSGTSRVAGRKYAWSAGDLMLSAPGWAVHNHASDEGESVYELTIQDQPFHLSQESLLWQEELSEPPALLGVERGFGTNRGELGS